eukprot:g14898.t1
MPSDDDTDEERRFLEKVIRWGHDNGTSDHGPKQEKEPIAQRPGVEYGPEYTESTSKFEICKHNRGSNFFYDEVFDFLEGIVDFFVGTVVKDVKDIQEGWYGKRGEAKEVGAPATTMFCVFESEEANRKAATETMPTTVCESWDFFEDDVEETSRPVAPGIKIVQHDRGGEFHNQAMRRAAEKEGIKVVMSSSYSPETNGKTEVKNKHGMASFLAEIGGIDGLKASADDHDHIRRCFRSAAAVENYAKGSKSGFQAFVMGSTVNFYQPGKRPFHKSSRRVGKVVDIKRISGTVSKYVVMEKTDSGVEIKHTVRAGAVGVHPPHEELKRGGPDFQDYEVIPEGIVHAADPSLTRVSTPAEESLLDLVRAAKVGARKSLRRLSQPQHRAAIRQYGRGRSVLRAASSVASSMRRSQDRESVRRNKQPRPRDAKPSDEVISRGQGTTEEHPRKRRWVGISHPGMASTPSTAAPTPAVTDTSVVSSPSTAFLATEHMKPTTFQLTPYFKGNSYFTAVISLLISRKMVQDFDISQVTDEAQNAFDLVDSIVQNIHGEQPRKLKERVEKVREVVMEGSRRINGMAPRELSVEDLNTPKGVLEALATTVEPRAGAPSRDAYVLVQNTRRVLGLHEGFKIVKAGRCEHEGKHVRESLTARYCWPNVIEVNLSESNVGDVRQALAELRTGEGTAGTERPCVLCAVEGRVPAPTCYTQRDWIGHKRDMFFVSLRGDGLTSESGKRVQHSHSVDMFGATFTLCGVVYRTRKGASNHYMSQLWLEGRWWEYNDLKREGNLEELGEFAPLIAGTEDMLMYVRASIVEGAFVAEKRREGSLIMSDDDDETYRLTAVIHKVVNGSHFICQALQNGCWHMYDDLHSSESQHLHEYRTEPEHDGAIEPCLLAYVVEEAEQTPERKKERDAAERKHDVAFTRAVQKKLTEEFTRNQYVRPTDETQSPLARSRREVQAEELSMFWMTATFKECSESLEGFEQARRRTGPNEEPNYTRQPSYGEEGQQRLSPPWFMRIIGEAYKKKGGFVGVKSMRCEETGCPKHAMFGRPGKQPQLCADHQAEGMVDVKSRRQCNAKLCQRRASYARDGEMAMFCSKHKQAGHVDVIKRRCEFNGCSRRVTFSRWGDKPRFCQSHKLEGMQDSCLNAEGGAPARTGTTMKNAPMAAEAEQRMYAGGHRRFAPALVRAHTTDGNVAGLVGSSSPSSARTTPPTLTSAGSRDSVSRSTLQSSSLAAPTLPGSLSQLSLSSSTPARGQPVGAADPFQDVRRRAWGAVRVSSKQQKKREKKGGWGRRRSWL